MIKWEKYFTRIYCGFFLPNKIRFPRLDAELSRVGIKDSGIFEYVWFTPSSFDNLVLNNIQTRPHLPIIKPAYVNHLRNLEEILRLAKMHNEERILIIEDDVAFIKNLNKIEDMLDAIPPEFAAFQMDKFILPTLEDKWRMLSSKNSINDFWVNSTGIRFTSAALNAFSKAGIDEMLRIIESTPGSVDQLASEFELPWAISKINLAIQVVYADAINLTYGSLDRIHAVYKNLDYNDYAVPINYSKGDML